MVEMPFAPGEASTIEGKECDDEAPPLSEGKECDIAPVVGCCSGPPAELMSGVFPVPRLPTKKTPGGKALAPGSFTEQATAHPQ